MAFKQFSTIMTKWHLHALKSNGHLTNSFVKCMSSSAANQPLNVGFIGLGNMGARMVNNLMKKVIWFGNFAIKKSATKSFDNDWDKRFFPQTSSIPGCYIDLLACTIILTYYIWYDSLCKANDNLGIGYIFLAQKITHLSLKMPNILFVPKNVICYVFK